MAKASSPIRLQAELMQAATSSGVRYHRSTAEQIEYWADMGRRVSSFIDPDTLLAVKSGLAKITVEPVHTASVNPDRVFQSLEENRRTGRLSKFVSTSTVKYQVSEEHPDYLVQIDKQNNIITGKFENGEFIPLDETSS